MSSRLIAEALGIHVGDGCISITERYCEYALLGDRLEEREYYDSHVSPIFSKILKRPIVCKEYISNGTYGFHIFNKKVVDFFLGFGLPAGSKLNIDIPNFVKKDQGLLKLFLRGLFDTDGNLYFDKHRQVKNPLNNVPQIKLDSTSKHLVYSVYMALRKFGFHPRLKKPYKGKRDKNYIYSVLLYRKRDTEKYIEEIGFKNQKHITKWKIFRKFGFCLPHTTLILRKKLLEQ